MDRKEELFEFNPQYGKIVPRSVKSFVDYAFEKGSQYARLILGNEPDAFQHCGSGERVYLDQNNTMIISDKTISYKPAELYYEIAFCNYWKNGVEKVLKEKGICSDDRIIKDEMLRTDIIFKKIGSLLSFAASNFMAVDLKGELEFGGGLYFSDNSSNRVKMNDYAKMLVDTFVTCKRCCLDCFAYGFKNILCASGMSVNDDTAAILFGDMYKNKNGTIWVDNISGGIYKDNLEKMKLKETEKQQNQDSTKGM